MSFDLIAFARHHGLDLHDLAASGRVLDTMLTSILVDPPQARTKLGQIKKERSLEGLAGRLWEDVAKTGDLKALAAEYGGFDRIPVDDARYATYAAGDVDIAARIASHYRETVPAEQWGYIKREHRIAAVAAQIRMNGFRVDLDLLRARLAANEARRRGLLDDLAGRYGLPMTKADGKPSKSPHATKAGKAAIVAAFADQGVTLPLTGNGNPATGKEALDAVREQHADNLAVVDLCEVIGSLNGIRTVYQTIDDYLVGDRVHPDISMLQASGRWSITEPGLTVMGKRGGKYVEREVFLPEPGHVIIAADLAQVDARVVAAWCQDPAYMELFEPGRDSHTEVALAVWNDAGRRDDAKILGHGWNYGMGLAMLAEKIGSEAAAQEFNRAMKERYPRLVAWKRDVATMADEGHLLDNGFGRKLRTTPGFGWTQGPALMGQSAARDVMMEGLLRMPREVHPYLRAVVHDEVVLSVPVDQVEDIRRAVVEALTFEWAPFEHYRPVRIEADCTKPGASWGEVYAK
jgi:DNA polymerase-1